jgi:hypothetical protein
MNTKIKKLISSCIAYSCCVCFPVSAFAGWTMEEVLKVAKIEVRELIDIGMYERVQEIIQEENDKIEQKKNEVCDIGSHNPGALAALPASVFPGAIGSIVLRSKEQIAIRIWDECREDLNAYRRAQRGQ